MKYINFNKFKSFLSGYFDFTSYLLSQEEAEASIRNDVTFKGPNILILMLAILIASLGLNTNSTAVIIGAMLISPLMGPIIGLGLGVGILDFDLIKRSVRNLAMATGVSVIASTIYFLFSPVIEGHSELLARTSPTIYDVLIGLFGGASGILAIGSRNKGNVIPGVAIATALMPPLCTAGYGIATWQLHYFAGAFYLFLINSIYIACATTIGVKFMKYTPKNFVDEQKAKKVKHTVYWFAILTMLPSIYLTYTMVRENNFATRTSQFINAEFNFPSTQVLKYNTQNIGGEKVINITLIGKILPTDSLQLALTAQLPRFGLAGTKLNIIQGDAYGSIDTKNLSSTMLHDIYQVTQSTINHQQSSIDSLKKIINKYNFNDSLSATIAPEIKILFPQINELAITKAVFSDINTSQLDSINLALIEFSTKMSNEQRQKLTEYLCARLKLNEINLVDISSTIKFAKTNKKNK